ncbi:MAG: MaoC family dehydratase N-terminal domain-containing protein [Burkholderiales bacterium]
MEVTQATFDRYIGMTGTTLVAGMPLERDTLRRFVQAIMDTDPLYLDAEYAKGTKYGNTVAPPLYPVHAFRPAPGGPDPLAMLQADPDADGSGGNDGVFFGLTPIESPFKRLLNGGNEIEFFRCLEVGERCVANARYADVRLREGKSGALLLVTIETTFSTEAGDRLLVNRQTLIWR